MSVHGAEAWVRINAWDTGLTMDDLNAVVIDGLDGITLPKCSGADDVKRLDFYRNRSGGKKRTSGWKNQTGNSH